MIGTDDPMLLPGITSITVNTCTSKHHPLRQLQLQRWNGKSWKRFGAVIEGAKI